MSFRYRTLLEDTARAAALAPEALLQTEEMEVAGHLIGLAYDGDDRAGDIRLFSEIGALPEGGGESALRALLEGNYFGVGSAGCTLAVRHDSDMVLLWGRFPIERLDTHTFVALLTRFAELATFWRERLRQAPTRGQWSAGLGF